MSYEDSDGILSHYYYYVSYLGDVLGLLNTEGELVGSYQYDGWGNLFNESDLTSIATKNPLRYRSYYYDTELSLYYLQSRYYDASTGRFISTDSTDYLDPSHLQGLNLYAYAINNPVMNEDPSGYFLISTSIAIGFWIGLTIGVFIGATVGGIYAYNTAKNNGANGWQLIGWTAIGIVGGGVIGAYIGAALGTLVGWGIGALWGTSSIAGSNGAVVLWSGGQGAAGAAASEFAATTGANIVTNTFAGKTLTFASHFIPKVISQFLWGKLSAEFVAGAASATIFLATTGASDKSVFWLYEIWELLSHGIPREIIPVIPSILK